MDRTEAHDWLCRLRSDFYIYMGGRIPEEGIKSFKEALDYAISSLETDEAYNLMYEDPEFCENCIDRELFIRDLYCKAQGETSINIHWLEGYIKQFPSVLPKADVPENNVGKIELTTKNDLGVDLVPRADVLKLMQDNWHTHNGDWAMQESMDDIRALPSVTPQEPKTGHWIDRDVYDADRWKCSECGRTEQYQENFCPNCGSYNGGDSNGNE